jgi:hypothetical protein
MEDDFVLKRYLVGVDIGQSQDYTAIATLKQFLNSENESRYELPALERVPLGTSYQDIVTYVVSMLKSPVVQGKYLEGPKAGMPIGTGLDPLEIPELVLDATGCGRPVAEMFAAHEINENDTSQLFNQVNCTITGGSAISAIGGFYGVPKKELVSNLETLVQTHRLQMPKDLEFGPVLVEELLNFRAKINTKTGNDSFEAWRGRDPP